MIRGRLIGGRASSISPATDDVTAVTADWPPTNPLIASALVLVPTTSVADRAPLANRRPASTVAVALPGPFRLPSELPRSR